jgi:hypothetical protein
MVVSAAPCTTVVVRAPIDRSSNSESCDAGCDPRVLSH